jgi:hypothetical protein
MKGLSLFFWPRCVAWQVTQTRMINQESFWGRTFDNLNIRIAPSWPWNLGDVSWQPRGCQAGIGGCCLVGVKAASVVGPSQTWQKDPHIIYAFCAKVPFANDMQVTASIQVCSPFPKEWERIYVMYSNVMNTDLTDYYALSHLSAPYPLYSRHISSTGRALASDGGREFTTRLI